MRLATEQVHFFRCTGFLRLSEHLPGVLIARLRDRLNNIAARGGDGLQRDMLGSVVRVSALVQRDPLFRSVFRSSLILEPLTGLLGPNIELALNRHNHATFNYSGSPLRLHRDVLQWSRSVITAIIYLEESDVNNGCTWIIPGSSSLPFVGMPNNGGAWMDEHDCYASLLEQAVPIPMPEGGILLLDSCAFHGPGENKTPGTRLSMTAAYHSVDELAGVTDDPKKLLVKGERVYKGNDRM